MQSTVRISGILSLILMSSLSCAQQQNTLQNLRGQAAAVGSERIQMVGTDYLTVIDEKGAPIAGATILLGYEADKPFPGNLLTTDDKGIAGIPADWKAALPMTVTAPGFIITTIPVAMPAMMSVQLTHQESAAEYEVKGTTTDFGTLVEDGKVDFGLVFPTLNRAQLLAFNLSALISPKVDTIDVLGKTIEIPSNITLPDQNETYIFPVNLNKPEYRTYTRAMGTYQMYATRGQFPLQKVVDGIQGGKSVFELVNYFNFISGGQKSVVVNGNVAGQDLPVNSIKFDKMFKVTAPDFAKGNIMITMPLIEDKDMLMPTDLKRLMPKQSMNLKSTGSMPSILSLIVEDTTGKSVAKSSSDLDSLNPLNVIDQYLVTYGMTAKTMQDFTRLSFALLPGAGGVAPQFLPLLAKPTLTGQVLKMDVPKLPADLTAVATYIVLSEIESIDVGKVKTERRTRLWEVFSSVWLDQFELPKITITHKSDRKYRWEVMFLARPTSFIGESQTTNAIDLKSITHVTRNALEI